VIAGTGTAPADAPTRHAESRSALQVVAISRAEKGGEATPIARTLTAKK
jgi:hypothetical protein